ncbi:MAG: hypothetical protein IRZ21_04375 [Thermoleophilaceae bacterium]|nr:hypothetical protein [Thermoleophilaceae bacterium]
MMYRALGWAVWRIGRRALAYTAARKRTRLAAAGVILLVLATGAAAAAARSGRNA